MKKTVFMSAAKKARIALAVLAVCGFTFAGAQEAFAENVTVDYHSNIIGGDSSSVTGIDGVVAPRWNVVLGQSAKAKGDSNIAVGDCASAEGDASTAVGAGSEAKDGATAIGHGSLATSEFSIALGTDAKASANGAVALGFNSTADEANTVSVGGIYQEILGYDPATREPIYESRLLTRKIVNVADGTKNTDVATYGQIIQAGDYTITLGTDGNGQVTLKTNAGANGPTIKVDASALVGGGSVTDDKANINGGNIVTTAPDSQWAEKLGIGKIEAANKDLVTGGTVFDKVGDTGKLTTAGLGDNLSDAVVKVNDKVGDTGKLTAAGLTSNKLSDAIVEVNDKTKQNAKDIEKVNGRVDELGGAVSKLDSKVNKVGAGAAALAALHPMEFDSDNKLTFAAGVGSYHGASAAAIGAFYRPSEQVMFSIAGNMGNGENMVNAGVSFALDRPSKTPTTKAALVKTVAAQNEQIAALSETVAEQNEKIARLEAMVEKLAAKQNA